MQRFQYLWQQYTRKKASDQELDELFSFIADPANQAPIEDFLETIGNTEQPLKNYDPRQWQRLVDAALNHSKEKFSAEIQHYAPESEPDTSIPIRRIHFMKSWGWAAAAVLIILFAGGAYLVMNRTNEKGTIAITNRKADVLPGHNGATLHLSNGNTIVLDSAADGTIALQGSVQAVKTNGELKYIGHSDEVVYNDITTDRGREWQLTLPDGTKVWLNAASSIHYPLTFKGPERLVEVTGEAYFEVVHDAKQPFKVKAGNQIIEDIGTAFNVNAYADDPIMHTTVLKGSVKIIYAEQAKILTAGEQAQIKGSGINIAKGVNVEEVMAWKNGFFNFNHVSLTEMLNQLSRWYDVDVVYQGTIAPKKFGGEIQRDLNLSEVLEALKETGVHFSIEERKLIVMP